MPMRCLALATCTLTFIVLPTPTLLSARQSPASVSPAPAERPAPTGVAAQDLIIERADTRARFESDGTGEIQVEFKVRVLTDAAVQQFAQVAYNYDAYQGTARFERVEVRKPSGQTSRAGADAVTDTSLQVLPNVQTDLHQLRAAVPGLAPGDVIEYRTVSRVTRPVVPGHFWHEYRFNTMAVVTEETVTIDVPSDRAVQVKTAAASEAAFAGTEKQGDRRVYRWKRSNPVAQTAAAMIEKAAEGRLDPPDVQVTSFRSWDELAAWYLEAARDRDRPDATVKAKAEELTRGLSSPDDKLRALYEFVATQCRYLSLSFGTGRLIPHAAAEVLGNQYGDCKDRHTLLSALARAVGIRTYAALISSSRLLDRTLPSPAQFDHMITVGVLGPSERDWVWLDSAPGVAPFGLISPSLRNKAALVLMSNGENPAATRSDAATRLVTTPTVPPFPCFTRTSVDARLTSVGALDSRVTVEVRGDAEVAGRAALRMVPADKHVEILKVIAGTLQLTGELTETSVSNPLSTRGPLVLKFHVLRDNWFDRSKNNPLVLPIEEIGFPYASESEWEGKVGLQPWSALENHLGSASIELPSGYVPKVPLDVAITRDYAEYRSTHTLDGTTLTVKRVLVTRPVEIPSERMRDYLAFVAAVRADEAQKISVDMAAAAPVSASAEATPSQFYSLALAAYERKDYEGAIDLWKKVVAANPKHRTAWDAVGLAHIQLKQWKEAAAALEEQVKIEPFHNQAWGDLAWALQHLDKRPEAISAYRRQIEIVPLDKYAHRRLGLLMLSDPPDCKTAASELAKAEQIVPDDGEVVARLGTALLQLGDHAGGLAAFERARKLSPGPGRLSEMAYDLADAGVELDRAIGWANEALRTATERSLKMDIATVPATPEQVRESWAVSWSWHALGWAAFKKGDYVRAEKYLSAARSVRLVAAISDHLSQAAAKLGRQKDAIRFAAESLVFAENPAVRERLILLTGGETAALQALEPARAAVLWERTAQFARVAPKQGSMQFVAIFTNGSLQPQVRATSDDPALRPLLDHVRKASFPVVFPDASPVKILTDGRLGCYEKGGDCVAFVYFAGRLPGNPRQSPMP